MLALNKVTSQPVLFKIASQDESSGIRYQAIMKLTNPDFLNKIAQTETNTELRKTAKKRIKEIKETK
jgi:hypothetical protein